MSKTNYDYIQFANYKDIPNWSVQYVVEEQLGFTKKYPMAKKIGRASCRERV